MSVTQKLFIHGTAEGGRGPDDSSSESRLQGGVQLVVMVTGAVAVAALRAGVVGRFLQPQQHVHLQTQTAVR